MTSRYIDHAFVYTSRMKCRLDEQFQNPAFRQIKGTIFKYISNTFGNSFGRPCTVQFTRGLVEDMVHVRKPDSTFLQMDLSVWAVPYGTVSLRYCRVQMNRCRGEGRE